MTQGSLESGDRLDLRAALRRVRRLAKRYFWFWIAYQTVKGLLTTTVVWAPLAYVFLAK